MNRQKNDNTERSKSLLRWLRIWYIIMIIFAVKGLSLSGIVFKLISQLDQIKNLIRVDVTLLMVIFTVVHLIFLILYIVSLIELKKGRFPYIPWGKTTLIVTLVFIPIGTIIGGIFLKKINNYRN